MEDKNKSTKNSFQKSKKKNSNKTGDIKQYIKITTRVSKVLLKRVQVTKC